MNEVHAQEVGPITRAMNAETDRLNGEIEIQNLRMLLTNLTTAACPYALGEEATDALIEAHKEASEHLGLGCPHCLARAGTEQYIREGMTQ